jgi:hypothetical protein
MSKVCSKCKEEKENSCFAKNKNRRDGLQTFCKECNNANIKTYYTNNQQKFIDYKNKRRAKLKNIIQERKLQCSVCGENHPATLDFHHRNPNDKDDSIAHLIHRGVSINRLLKEIDKCDILCSNCHRKKHYDMQP